MKKNLITLAITTGILSLALPTGLRAEDQKPTTSDSGGGSCNGPCGGCKDGGKKSDKDANKGEKPAPAPSPAQ